MTFDVQTVSPGDLEWTFRGAPSFRVGNSSTALDPFPCYPHDFALVAGLLEEMCARFPLGSDVTYYLAEFEDAGRVNAFATYKQIYVDCTCGDETESCAGSCTGGWRPADRYVFMSGKRTPIHKAMTRHVTVHEYGHEIQWTLELVRGMDSDSLKEEYREFRGLPKQKFYGGQTWHLQPGEVFADDFRILLMNTEPDHWPHPGVSHPLEDLAVQTWWAKARADLLTVGY